MQIYDPAFARVYNARWAGFAHRVAPLIFDFYEQTPTGHEHKSLLDLCCGTGQLAGYFLARDYRVTGLDSSPGMLAHARENARAHIEAGQARFIEGDAADYALDAPVGLVVATYDALNHLPDRAALRGAFRSTHAALVDGGWFIFDLNTRAGLLRWSGVNVQNDEDALLITRGVVVAEQDRAYTQITGFTRQESGLYERFEQVAYNTMFDLAEVEAALREAGFRRAYCARVDALDTPLEHPESESRVFIVAQK